MFFNIDIERIIKKNIFIFNILGCVFKINSINNFKFCSNISAGGRNE